MTPDEIRAIVDKVKAELPGHTWTSGTVTRAVSDAGFASVVEVVLDGDLTETVIQATNLTATPMTGGVRVKVVFDPPEGVYVIGVLPGPNSLPVCRLECFTGNDDGVATWGAIRVQDGGMSTDLQKIIMPLSGLVTATARLQYEDGPGAVLLGSYNSAGTLVSYVDRDSSSDLSGSLGMASAAIPVLAGGWLQVECTNTASLVQGTHFAAHYVAPYQDFGVSSCSGG